MYYDQAQYPNLRCLPGRVLASTVAVLDAEQRAELWAGYGLEVAFEWVNDARGFSYYELKVAPLPLQDKLRAWFTGAKLPPRRLPELVAALADDPRVSWAAPDALVLKWATPGPEIHPPYGVSFLDEFTARRAEHLQLPAGEVPVEPPLPDFEYYRIAEPVGTRAAWAEELEQQRDFMEQYGMVYGTAQAAALDGYLAQGAPPLAPITVCVADTGVQLNHPDLAGRLHPQAIDANYTNYKVAAAEMRPEPEQEITAREEDPAAIGLPRSAIRDRPASHGTAVAGIVVRCTDGFYTSAGPVRILPASVKSELAFTLSSALDIKSPISAFIKLVACLDREFPVAAAGDPTAPGPVRVVTTSASIPRSYFTDGEWEIVSQLVDKAVSAIAEDLADNDRLYLFAAGNEAQGEPSRPGDSELVLPVSASMAYDGTEAWHSVWSDEGSNMGPECVSAPGYGIITSQMVASPNLRYLPDAEFRPGLPNFSTPPRQTPWIKQMPDFSATSSATPQVASLAALLYAQQPERTYTEVKQAIIDSTADRVLSAPWGESMGLIDYRAALGWGVETGSADR